MAMSRSLGRSAFTTRAPLAISPGLISWWPAILRSSVDLPQPEGPTSTQNSPSAMEMSTPCTTSVEPKDLRTPRNETADIVSPPRENARACIVPYNFAHLKANFHGGQAGRQDRVHHRGRAGHGPGRGARLRARRRPRLGDRPQRENARADRGQGRSHQVDRRRLRAARDPLQRRLPGHRGYALAAGADQRPARPGAGAQGLHRAPAHGAARYGGRHHRIADLSGFRRVVVRHGQRLSDRRGNDDMKLCRYGRAGYEKPGLVDADGRVRDLSKIVDDIGSNEISPRGLNMLTKHKP